MQIYWTLKSIPELADLPWRERGRLWRQAFWRSLSYGSTWAGILACGVTAAVGAMIGDMVGHGSAGAALGGGIGGFIAVQNTVRIVRRNNLIGGDTPN